MWNYSAPQCLCTKNVIYLFMLSAQSISKAIKDREISITGLSPSNVQYPYFELRFSSDFYNYEENIEVDIRHKYSQNIIKLDTASDNSVLLPPGMFLLNKSQETVSLSENLFGLITTRGSLAQFGLQIHLSSLHIDPGTNSTITFEIKNLGNNSIRIYPGEIAAKVYLFKIE